MIFLNIGQPEAFLEFGFGSCEHHGIVQIQMPVLKVYLPQIRQGAPEGQFLNDGLDNRQEILLFVGGQANTQGLVQLVAIGLGEYMAANFDGFTGRYGLLQCFQVWTDFSHLIEPAFASAERGQPVLFRFVYFKVFIQVRQSKYAQDIIWNVYNF